MGRLLQARYVKPVPPLNSFDFQEENGAGLSNDNMQKAPESNFCSIHLNYNAIIIIPM